MSDRAYFDWNATTPLRDEARRAMVDALDLPGNASSVHAEGREARKWIEGARTDEALPGRSSASIIARRASSRSGVVAFQSK
jgi:cysteine desulfurase